MFPSKIERGIPLHWNHIRKKNGKTLSNTLIFLYSTKIIWRRLRKKLETCFFNNL